MDFTLNDSLNTTASSLDLGTTMDESFNIVTSTPLKPLPKVLTDLQCTSSGPPPKPTGPKPKTVVRRRSSRAANVPSCHPTTIAMEGRLRSMSFKRRMLKIRLDQLQIRTNSLKIRDQQIIRRHTALCQEISKMVDDCGETSLDFSNESTPTKRFKTGSMSYSNIIPFQRNSVTRRPRPRKSNRSPLQKANVGESPVQVIEPMIASTAVPSLELSAKPSKKVRKPPSFRLKRFVQRTFGKKK